MECNLAATVDNYRITEAKVSFKSYRGCRSWKNGNIVMNWIKASGFDYFDKVDTSFTGTGVIRAKNGVGCLSVVPDQWYWMAFVSTRVNTTHCEI